MAGFMSVRRIIKVPKRFTFDFCPKICIIFNESYSAIRIHLRTIAILLLPFDPGATAKAVRGSETTVEIKNCIPTAREDYTKSKYKPQTQGDAYELPGTY
jgi:hypothetical protein